MGKEQFKLKLSDLKKKWGDAYEHKDEFGGSFTPEAGTYALVLTSATVGQAKTSGRLQVTWEVTFLKGEYKTKTKKFFDGLDSETSIPFILRRIEALGEEAPEEFDGLEDTLKKLTKKHPKFKGRITTKGEFQNLQVEKLLTAEEVDELEEGIDDTSEAPVESEAPAAAPTKTVSKETGGKKPAVVKFEAGMAVTCDEGDGTIVSVDEDSGDAIVKIGTKKHIIDLKDLTPAKAAAAESATDPDELVIEVGKEVLCLDEDEDELGRGEILEIDKKQEEVIVKIGKKKHVVSFSNLRP